MNKVILMGNLTRDPELRYAQGKGTPVTKFAIATNRVWFDDKGERKEETTFVDVTAFGKTAETIAQHVKKAHRLLVEGRLHLDQWEDKTTKKPRQKLNVVLEHFEFAGGAK